MVTVFIWNGYCIYPSFLPKQCSKFYICLLGGFRFWESFWNGEKAILKQISIKQIYTKFT